MYIKDIKEKIEIYEKLLKIIDIEAQNTTEKIFLIYAQSGKVAEVAAYVNNEGLRLKGKNKPFRKYISDDITRILEDKNNIELVDKNLYKLVLKMKKTKKITDKIIEEVFNEK